MATQDVSGVSNIDVLIAEDSPIQAAMLRRRLLKEGYSVRIGKNGADALEQIRQRKPMLVLSDIEMPEMTGYELCHAVKQDPGLRDIPFILLSTLAEPEDIIRGLHCGADNYVTKPYDPEYLLLRIKSLLATPLGEDDDSQQLDVTLAGTRYRVKSGRQQVLNLLVSTFENAVEKNKELLQLNEELTLAQDKLSRSNRQLALLNDQLEAANERMAHDLDAAAKVQHSLLPASLPDTTGLACAWRFMPCDELAGDFLNFFTLDEKHIAAFVVDVSGHGVASSLLSVTIGRLLTPQVSSTSLLMQPGQGSSQPRVVPPAEVAYELNQRFSMDDQSGLYFTMGYGVLNLETLEFRYVSAGHPSPVYVPRDGSPQLLEATGMAIGWVDDIEFDEQVLHLHRGDRLYLYSDGVPEAMDEDLNEFGDQRMLDSLSKGKLESLDESVALLLQDVQNWCSKNGPKDDVSILAWEVSN